jgi:hypothetical protein
MIVVDITEETKKWWIVYNEDKSVVNYGETEPPQQTESGLPLFQVFDNELNWLDVLLNEFNITIENNI